MGVAAELELEAERRGHSRSSTSMPAGLREASRTRYAVEVVDVSTHGCRVEISAMFSAGARMWLHLPGLEGWEAKIAWRSESEVGLDFIRPLHPAVAADLAGRFGCA
jgi:hypothetical protein